MTDSGEDEPQLKSLRFDPRYPFTNQTKACWKNYCDFYKCQRLLGEDVDGCLLFKNIFQTLCPNYWIEKWDEQRSMGIFPGPI